ncbi:MAG: S8 family serine peptidase [Acidobacteria bacterium]|nr:S8 family serine peptidase [Acidobacteriota bacterium]
MVRALWLGNVVGVELTRDEIQRVATRADVARINWNPKRDVSLDRKLCSAPPKTSPLDVLAPAFGTDAENECGVALMRAPEVWNDLGNTGDGAVVAVIDSGVCWTHSDIVNQIWVNPGEDLDGDRVVMDAGDENGIDDDGNGFIDDLIGWNFEIGTNEPSDDNSHGSHCAGTVAGDGTAGFQSGMAPDAKIMVVKVGLNFSDEVDVWNAMQYAAENGADAISMSLGWPHSQNPDRATWRNNCENTIDLGTAMVIAAGNEGSGSEPDNVRTPGDVPRVITVGATDCSDAAAGFSSRGPVGWQDVSPFNDHPYPPGLIKPDVSAPGVDTRSHNVCSGYSYKSGTSMATPHVAGAVALMRSANAGLTHDDIKQLLQDTSIDLGTPDKDNTFGAGRVARTRRSSRAQRPTAGSRSAS